MRTEAGNTDNEEKHTDTLAELDKFAALYSCYPATILYIYRVRKTRLNVVQRFSSSLILTHCSSCTSQVYCDMLQRKQYIDVNIFDGKQQWGYSQYILEGKLLTTEKTRYVVPISVDANIDLKK